MVLPLIIVSVASTQEVCGMHSYWPVTEPKNRTWRLRIWSSPYKQLRVKSWSPSLLLKPQRSVAIALAVGPWHISVVILLETSIWLCLVPSLAPSRASQEIPDSLYCWHPVPHLYFLPSPPSCPSLSRLWLQLEDQVQVPRQWFGCVA